MRARRGELADALALARRAVEGWDETDFFDLRSKIRLALAEVLACAGDTDEVERLADEVLAIHEAKGDVTGRAWARRRLESLGAYLAWIEVVIGRC
jgi:hypothetical protein